jgi:hypothetical protein
MTDEERRKAAAERSRLWRANNPDRHAENQRKWAANNKEKRAASNKKWSAGNRAQKSGAQRAYRSENHDRVTSQASAGHRLRKYGITQEQFNDMLSAQNSACSICGTKEPKGRNNTFHVDHCHTTQRVRGLLCHKCNVGLGHFKDSPAALRTAATYIEVHAR